MIKYTHDTALTEASRCLMCEDAPCHGGCPSSVNPKLFIRKIRFADLAGAAKMLRNANILAGSTAYICPCLSTCGSKCTAHELDRPINISALQRFVMDWERENGLAEINKAPANGRRIAVIGSGPAGLACSAWLAQSGYQVEIFERHDVAGGQLRLSIPEFRLPAKVIDHEVAFVKKLGVQIQLNSEIKDIKKLKHDGFDAVYLSPGLMGSRRLGIAGEEKKGVYQALDFFDPFEKGRKNQSWQKGSCRRRRRHGD
ncbi:MAG: NAD(P)-binding protein [Deltaproteobacteria bacterium]|nr:NAD(P)-binding protein [Deltaproteobacteria bacterium]